MSISSEDKEGKYIIEKQADGNYIGTTLKFGKLVTVRDIGPEVVLLALITHDGKEK